VMKPTSAMTLVMLTLVTPVKLKEDGKFNVVGGGGGVKSATVKPVLMITCITTSILRPLGSVPKVVQSLLRAR
jgi:hypothetical protein